MSPGSDLEKDRAAWARWWHLLTGTAVLAGLVIQIILVARLASAPRNTNSGVIAGATIAGRYLRTISFFTIQSNILAAVTALQLARKPDRDGRAWRALRLAALLGITVTGIVYATVLARIHEPKGWEQVTTNTLFHYVSPVAMVLGWLAFGPRPRITWSTLVAALSWPAAWFAYTLARGAADRWYPYPFVDVVTHGYVRVIVNGLIVTVVLGAVGLLYRAGDQWLPWTPGSGGPP